MTDDFRELQYAFAAHVRDPAANPVPDGLDDRRVAIYRDLFFNNIESLLAGNFPVIRSLHDVAAWRTLVRKFYATHPSHTPLFPEIGREFVRFLEAQDTLDPPFLAELAHYEWAELAVSIDESSIDDIPHDPHGDVVTGVPVASPLAWCLVYRYPVHRIRVDFQPKEAPEQPTCLVIARDRRDDVTFLEATPVIVRLVEHVKESPHRTGLEHVHALLAEMGATGHEELIATASDMLRQLHARDILLGTRS